MRRTFIVPVPPGFDLDADPESLVGQPVTYFDPTGVGAWVAERVEIDKELRRITIWCTDE